MKLKIRYQVLLLLFVVLGVYYPTLFGMANSLDDQKMLHCVLNTDHRHWFDLFVHGSRKNYYRPLLMASFYADRYLWMLEESFMHLENVLLHAWNSFMVFWIAREVEKALNLVRGIHWAPLTAGLFFALHPVNTEPVNWISGRTDLLAGAFLLAGVWLLLRGLGEKKPYFSWGGGFLFLCACLAKETAMFFFPAGMFFCFWHWGETRYRFWRDGAARVPCYYWSWVVAFVSYFSMRYAAKPIDKAVAQVVKASGGDTHDFVDGVRIFLKAGGFYVKKLFVPWPLNFAILGASNWYVVLGVVFIIGIVVWLWRHSLLAMIFLAMACLLSSALLVPLLNMTWTPLAERYLYLPSAFFAIGLVYWVVAYLQPLTEKQFSTIATISAFAVFATCAISTYQRNLVWQDNLSLFQDTDRKSPNFPPVRNELAIALIRKGHAAEGDAIFLDNKVKRGASEKHYLPVNRALLLWRQGECEAAGRLFWEAAERSRSTAPTTLKTYLKLMERWPLENTDVPRPDWLRPEMLRVQEALYERTQNPFWLYRQGKYYLAEGKREKALGYFQKTLKKASDNAFYKEAAKRFVENLTKAKN